MINSPASRQRAAAINIETQITGTDATPNTTPPRARGQAHVSVRARGGRSELADLRQSGSMRVLFPRPSSPPTAMLLNTAGGITGGDAFDIDIAAATESELTVTTQAAERAYAAMPGPAGRLRSQVRLEPAATLRWLPQETILFDGCALERSLEVDLAEGSEFLMVEPVVFGRAAHGETLRNAQFRDRVTLRRDGRIIYADGVNLSGDIAAQMAHPATGNGAGAMATVLLASPRAEGQLTPLRTLIAEISGNCVGTSLIAPDLLALRALAEDSFHLRRVLLPVLDHLTGHRLPICWRL